MANTDKFRRVGKPGTATTLSAPGHTSGGTSITVGSTTNWPTTTGVTFAIDRVTVSGSTETQVAGSYTLWVGDVTGATTIANMTLHSDSPNSDQDYPAGSTTRVYIPVSTATHNDMVTGILVDHGQAGDHETLTDANGNEWLERGQTASAVNHVKVTNAATGNAPAVEASGSDTNVDLVLDGKGTGRVRVPTDSNLLANINPPQGYMINGKLNVSVASNNITVAIKTLAGADPSATDPVYVRIGNTVRSITSALSVTKNAGTNWMNLGAAEHATQDVDLFAYMGYNATDGVTIGFARIPYARVYSDFSATTTNDKYCAISTITNAASTDEYEVVGRFNATLSAAASYNWSVPGTSIVVNRPIYDTRWLTFDAQWSSLTPGNGTEVYEYKLSYNELHLKMRITGGTTSSASGGAVPTFNSPISTSSSYIATTPLGAMGFRGTAVGFGYVRWDTSSVLSIASYFISGTTVADGGLHEAFGNTDTIFISASSIRTV